MRPGAAESDDAVLLRAVARGDEEALAALYDRHAGWLTVRMTRRCAMPDVVDQAVQDTFLVLWRGGGGGRAGGGGGAGVLGGGERPLVGRCRPRGGARAAPGGGRRGVRRSRRWSSRRRIRCWSASSTAAWVRPWPGCRRNYAAPSRRPCWTA